MSDYYSDDRTYEFVSHISGKNAIVRIYPTFIEWRREGSEIARWVKAGMTVGVSLLGGKKDESFTLPMKDVTSVRIEKDGLRNSAVVVSSRFEPDLRMRVSHEEAKKVQARIMEALS